MLAGCDGLWCYRLATAAEGIEFANEFQQHVHGGDVAIWAEVCAEAFHYLTSLKDAWQIFVGDNDARISLSVLEKYVISGRPLLDEVVFEQESIFLCLDDYILDIVYLRNQNSSLSAIVFFGKIGIDTALQVLRLADIDDGAGFVEILIAARAVGQIVDYAHQVGPEFILPAFFHCVFSSCFFVRFCLIYKVLLYFYALP